MSLFVNKLRTFSSDILGESKQFKINNAVWVYLEADFKLSQAEWAKGYEDNQAIYGSYFVACVLKANGYEVQFDDVVQNLDLASTTQFIIDYQMAMFDIDDEEEKETETEGE